MARTSRIVVPNQPHYIIQRGNDRQRVFRDDDDCKAFLGWLREAARRFKVAVHAYALMASEVQLLVTPVDEQGLARMMQWIGRFYVPYFNRKYVRTGSLWEGRFRTSIIDAEHYFMACSRHIETGPVRVGLAAEPAAYPWSSYAHHVGDRPGSLISDHQIYWAMGNTPFEREAIYRKFMAQIIPQEEVETLDQAISKGRTLGSEQFKISLEKRINRRIRPAKRGRPMKKTADQDRGPDRL